MTSKHNADLNEQARDAFAEFLQASGAGQTLRLLVAIGWPRFLSQGDCHFVTKHADGRGYQSIGS